jgi:hypothetical protein
MAPDERSRVEASQALADQLGSAAAAALMECIPPYGWHEIATKRDLDELEERMTLRMEAMEARLQGAIDRLDGRIDKLDGRIDKAVSAQNRALVLVVAGAVLASVVTNLVT